MVTRPSTRDVGPSGPADSVDSWWSFRTREDRVGVARVVRAPSPDGAVGGECGGSGLDVGHDVLDPRVILEPVHRQVLAIAAVLVTPCGISATIGMWVLIHTQPKSSARDIRIARPKSLVHTDEASP